MNLLQRFESRVVKTDGCWFWTGGTDRQGYGQFAVFATNVKAYRFAYELYVEMVPKGRELHHICENRICVKPSHLEIVTRDENMARAARIQPARGLRYDTASSEIRRRRAALGWTRERLAEAAGVSVPTVVSAEVGKHIPRDATLWKFANALGCSFDDLTRAKLEAVS